VQDTVTALKKTYHAKNKKYYPARQRLTLPPKEGQKSGEALRDDYKLSKYGLSNGSVVQFKDLGTQVLPHNPLQSAPPPHQQPVLQAQLSA
jgi:very-long-chain enoyl-CoA reductase